MENRRNRPYLNLPALQERPVTLGELLYRDGLIERPVTPPPQRPMGRTMSPTRCLGPLANGRPRRARGRTITRPSTSSATNNEDIQGESQQPRRTPRLRPLLSWRSLENIVREETSGARIRNVTSLMNGQRGSRRRGTATTNRPGNRDLAGRSDSPEPLSSSISWQRRSTSAGVHRTRRRTSINSGSRANMAAPRRSQRTRRVTTRALLAEDRPRGSRAAANRHRHARASRNQAASTESGENNGINNSNSGSVIPLSFRRFIDFAAEFIPAEERRPDAEPPEWSLNVTAADFGPFAIGRSAISRARSLAMLGALSVDSDVTGAPGYERRNPNEN